MNDVIIIGAGVNGCFLARDLSKYKLNILVLEKGDDVASGATMANSAIIHSGYDPVVGTNKAYFNVKGNAMYDQICKDLDVPFYRIGSLTLAFSLEEFETLKELQIRGKENGVETILLTKEEVLELEPLISKEVVGALKAPTAGIINPFELCAHLMENACDNGVKINLNEEVIDIKKTDYGYLVITPKGRYETKVVINACGVHTGEITSLIEKIDYESEPRKGEYFVLHHFDNKFLNHTLFTLPTKKGKGVLISPTTSWNYLVGPSSEPSEGEDTSTDSLTLNRVLEQALRMMPTLPIGENIRVFSGVRPTASKHDFIIRESETNPLFFELAGVESPGLASSPAISSYVVSLLSKRINLIEKESYSLTIKPYVRMKSLSLEERNKLIKEKPLYGRIVCRCEQISEQEIRDLFTRSFVPTSVKAIKKRVRAGFGKCQGGMCQPLVVKILIDELKLDPLKVRYDGNSSEILKYDLKEDR